MGRPRNGIVFINVQSSQTSQTLLNRVQANDQEAWSQFTRLYGPIVYAWCRHAALQPDDIDDVVQDVFRTVSLRLDTFSRNRKPSGAFRSWLWGITRNKMLDHFRSVNRQPIGQGGTDAHMTLQQLEAAIAEPESIDNVSAEQILLQSAIGVLKTEFAARTWQAFWDMAVKGRPAKDIGEELDMTAKAVRQARFRVAKKLRELLEDSEPELVKQYAGDSE